MKQLCMGNNNSKDANIKVHMYLEYGVNVEQSQKVQWPENLVRIGLGMWGEAETSLRVTLNTIIISNKVK